MTPLCLLAVKHLTSTDRGFERWDLRVEKNVRLMTRSPIRAGSSETVRNLPWIQRERVLGLSRWRRGEQRRYPHHGGAQVPDAGGCGIFGRVSEAIEPGGVWLSVSLLMPTVGKTGNNFHINDRHARKDIIRKLTLPESVEL